MEGDQGGLPSAESLCLLGLGGDRTPGGRWLHAQGQDWWGGRDGERCAEPRALCGVWSPARCQRGKRSCGRGGARGGGRAAGFRGSGCRGHGEELGSGWRGNFWGQRSLAGGRRRLWRWSPGLSSTSVGSSAGAAFPPCAEAGSSLRPSVCPAEEEESPSPPLRGCQPWASEHHAASLGERGRRPCGHSLPGPRNPALSRCSTCARWWGRGGQPPRSQGGPRGRRDKQPLLVGALGEGRGGQNHAGAWHIPREPAWQGVGRPDQHADGTRSASASSHRGCPAPAFPGPSELGLELP